MVKKKASAKKEHIELTSDYLSTPVRIKQRSDLTKNQKAFLKLAHEENTKVVFMTGPAGTSKTFLSILAALEMLNRKKAVDILYCRSIVESSDNKMGFLPGDIQDKVAPYMDPFLEKLEEHLEMDAIKNLQTENRLHVKSTGFLRGLSWNNRVIVVDEAQNMTKKELVTLLTRIGDNCRVFICGDCDQSDIGNKSGLKEVSDLLDSDKAKEHGIHVFKFTEEDIVRSKIVRFIVETLLPGN